MHTLHMRTGSLPERGGEGGGLGPEGELPKRMERDVYPAPFYPSTENQ